MLALQALQVAARSRGVLVKNFDACAEQGCARELRQLAAQVLVAKQRLEHVVDVDDLEVGIRHQHRCAGVIESGAYASAHGCRRIRLRFLEPPQLVLHLIQGEQHLAGLVGAGKLDTVVVAACGDRVEDRYRVSHRIDHRPGDQCAQRQAEQHYHRQRNAVHGGDAQLGLNAVGQGLNDAGVDDHGEIGERLGDGFAFLKDVLTLGRDALGIEHLRLNRAVIALEGLHRMAEGRQHAAVDLPGIAGGLRQLRTNRPESALSLVEVLCDRFAVAGANVAGKRGPRRSQAHAACLVHYRWQVVGGRRNQEPRIRLRIVREPGLHPDAEVELQDLVSDRIVPAQAVGWRELGVAGLQVLPG